MSTLHHNINPHKRECDGCGNAFTLASRNVEVTGKGTGHTEHNYKCNDCLPKCSTCGAVLIDHSVRSVRASEYGQTYIVSICPKCL